MFRSLFSKKQTRSMNQEPQTEENLSYKGLLSLLEELTEDDVKLVETYLVNLKHRRKIPFKSSQINQRTKRTLGKQDKTIQPRERTLDDEIQEAKDKLVAERIAASDRRN